MAEGQHLPAVRDVQCLLDYCRPFYRHWDDALAGRLLQTLDLAPTTALARASRGERMKAALVATLAFHPEVLILDEPLEGLDPLTREQVVDGLLELVSAEGTTLLIASHDLDVLERLLDQVAMLHDGRVVFTERLDDLQSRYRLLEVRGVSLADAVQIARQLHRRPRHRHRYAMPADPVRRGPHACGAARGVPRCGAPHQSARPP